MLNYFLLGDRIEIVEFLNIIWIADGAIDKNGNRRFTHCSHFLQEGLVVITTQAEWA